MYKSSLLREISTLLFLTTWNVSVATGDEARQNADAMRRAARSLTYPELLQAPENSAYMLEKQETVIADVAAVFGFADNRAACEQIAEVLTASGVAGSFKCQPLQ